MKRIFKVLEILRRTIQKILKKKLLNTIKTKEHIYPIYYKPNNNIIVYSDSKKNNNK